MADDEQRTGCGSLEELPHAFRRHLEREHRVAEPGLVSRDRPIEYVAGHAAVEGRIRPSAMRVVAGNRDQDDGYALREKLPEAGPVQGIEEELVPVRRAAV